MVWFLMNFKITHLVHWLFSDDPQIITLWPQLTPDDLDDDNYYICIWNRNNEFKIIFRRFENLRISSRLKLEHLSNLADVCTLNISYLIPSRIYDGVYWFSSICVDKRLLRNHYVSGNLYVTWRYICDFSNVKMVTNILKWSQTFQSFHHYKLSLISFTNIDVAQMNLISWLDDSDVGDIVMSVTLRWWPIWGVDSRIIMLVTFFVILVIFPLY